MSLFVEKGCTISLRSVRCVQGYQGRHTLLLHLEGVGGLGEEVGGILVLFLASAKEAEAAARALQGLLGLRRGKTWSVCVATRACAYVVSDGGGGVMETSPFGEGLEDPGPWL